MTIFQTWKCLEWSWVRQLCLVWESCSNVNSASLKRCWVHGNTIVFRMWWWNTARLMLTTWCTKTSGGSPLTQISPFTMTVWQFSMIVNQWESLRIRFCVFDDYWLAPLWTASRQWNGYVLSLTCGRTFDFSVSLDTYELHRWGAKPFGASKVWD